MGNLGYRVWGFGYRRFTKNGFIHSIPYTPYPIPHTLRFKSAFTLIELLVYMAIMGFIIVVAGRVFSDSTSMRVRSQNMIKSSEEVGKLAALINEDVSQMGTKAYGTSSASGYKVVVVSQVYMDAAKYDSASYRLVKNNYGLSSSSDSLAFRKIAMDQNGAYNGVREISWYVKRGTDSLFRKCRTSTASGTAPTECPSTGSDSVFIGKVTKLQFFPSKPGVGGSSSSMAADTLLPTSSNSQYKLQAQPDGGDVVFVATTESGDVSTAYLIKNGDGGKKRAVICLAKPNGTCMDFKFIQGETYAIEFEMPFNSSTPKDLYSTQFLPGEDHLSIGLRKPNYDTIGGAPPDILIYPPQSSEDLLKHVEFSLQNTIDKATVAITMAFYSPKAQDGIFKFRNFKVFRRNDRAFHFPRGNYGAGTGVGTAKLDSLKDRKSAKAFELILEVDNRGEKAGTTAKNGSGMVILTPNNGITAGDL